MAIIAVPKYQNRRIDDKHIFELTAASCIWLQYITSMQQHHTARYVVYQPATRKAIGFKQSRMKIICGYRRLLAIRDARREAAIMIILYVWKRRNSLTLVLENWVIYFVRRFSAFICWGTRILMDHTDIYSVRGRIERWISVRYFFW